MEKAYMEILLEEIRGKFDLVLEGYAVLDAKIEEFRREVNERLDVTNFKIQTMSGEIAILKNDVTAVKHDLTAHRADTESHPRYIVRE